MFTYWSFFHLKIVSGALEHFWHIILFEFSRGSKAAEATRNICAMNGENAIGKITIRKLFSCFKKDRFDISDIPRSGSPSRFDEDRLNPLIYNDTRQCTRDLTNVMNCDHSTIVWHLDSMGKVKKSSVWVPHALRQNHNQVKSSLRRGLCLWPVCLLDCCAALVG